ncbi:hypothetical protein CTI12_AA367270 [Artemisia annua]|uniref:Uncharacterized protein n=1 Tax=Artemisia annua TaxID=35608 RepID=A0A2U1MKV9_ARTAN|nr:hypothetical protein CTI12_AA367270 [Artemisia annua]
MKPVISVANAVESDLATPESNPHVKNVMELASQLQSHIVTVSAQTWLSFADNLQEEYREMQENVGVIPNGTGGCSNTHNGDTISPLRHNSIFCTPSKVNEHEADLGPLTGRNSLHYADACLRTYLDAWNWKNVCSFLVAMGDISLRKSGVEDKKGYKPFQPTPAPVHTPLGSWMSNPQQYIIQQYHLLNIQFAHDHMLSLQKSNAFRLLAAVSFLDIQDLCAIWPDVIISEL